MSESPRIIPLAGQRPDRDAQTAQLLRSGDPDALRRLLADHGGTVLGRLKRDFDKVLDQQEIEDALSRASLRVWRAGKSYDPTRGSLAAWLYVISRNCARRVLQLKRRDAGYAYLDELDSSVAVAPSLADADDAEVPVDRLAADVSFCIESLPPQQRAVLLADLAAGGAADTEVLADQLGTSRNSIYVSRNNGRKALRAALLALGHDLVPGVDAVVRRQHEAT